MLPKDIPTMNQMSLEKIRNSEVVYYNIAYLRKVTNKV